MTKDRNKIHIYGKQPVNEAIESDWPVFEITVRGKTEDSFVGSILEKARGKGIRVSSVNPKDFDTVYAKESQGIVAKVGRVRFEDPGQLLSEIPLNQDPLFLALDGIQDPQNLGSICRTAHAMGVHGLVVPRRRTAPFGEGAFKASAGAIFHQSICEVPNIHQFVRWCKKEGIWVCGLDVGSNTQSLWEMDLTGPIAFVVGGENRGLSRLVRERCDFLAKIPMFGRIDSLNAGIACAMALYEVQRQRNLRK